MKPVTTERSNEPVGGVPVRLRPNSTVKDLSAKPSHAKLEELKSVQLKLLNTVPFQYARGFRNSKPSPRIKLDPTRNGNPKPLATSTVTVYVEVRASQICAGPVIECDHTNGGAGVVVGVAVVVGTRGDEKRRIW